MATNKWCLILLQLMIFGFHNINSQTLKTTSCTSTLQNYFTYLTTPAASYRYLTIQATFILENRYVAYYIGTLYYAKSIDSLNGTTTVSFSDRTWIPSCGSFFCPSQNFNYKNTDIQTITISRSGAIKYTLNSWGNAVFTDQLQCYGVGEPLYTAPTVQSASMFVMTLQEKQAPIIQ
jgi:hypothetical protein